MFYGLTKWWRRCSPPRDARRAVAQLPETPSRSSPLPSKLPDVDVDDSEQSADFYDEAYASRKAYHVHYTSSPYYFLWCVIIDRLRDSKPQSILDIGCGPGQFARLLNDSFDVRITGVDFSSTAIEMARRNVPTQNFICEDMRVSSILTFADYDHVVSLEFLEHVSFDIDILKSIKSGTRCILSVPDFPATGHIRHFTNRDQVYQRYGRFFVRKEVSYWLLNAKRESGFYLFDGIKI